MLQVSDDILSRVDEIGAVAGRHGALSVRIVGSWARGEATKNGDLDLLVAFEEGRSGFDRAGLQGDLEALLGRKVDVVDAADQMHPRIRAQMLREAVPLAEAPAELARRRAAAACRGRRRAVKDPLVYVEHMREAVADLLDFTREGRDEFLANRMRQDAVIRKFEVLGEAAKAVPPDFRRKWPQVPWRGAAAFRDRWIHRYWRVDLDRVWEIVETELPPLQVAINEVLQAESRRG